MRPASIIQFERLYLAAVVAGLIGQVLGWDAVTAAVASQPGAARLGAGFVVAGLAVVYAAMLALWYFAARRHSVVAKWILAIWFVLSAVTTALSIYHNGLHITLAAVVGWVSFLLLAWSVSYLFKPDAEAWFAGTGASPE